MPIPTEPIGSIPRPLALLHGIRDFNSGKISNQVLRGLYVWAIRDTIANFEATGSPVITDGEQAKPSFATYPIHGLDNLAPDGVVIPFADGHVRQLPRLTAGPFRYRTYADSFLVEARKYAHAPVKQAVIAASALSLLYPQDGIAGYSREAFLEQLVREAEADIRRCLSSGAHSVQIDFTEGRLSVKLDPTKRVLTDFIALNNRVLAFQHGTRPARTRTTPTQSASPGLSMGIGSAGVERARRGGNGGMRRTRRGPAIVRAAAVAGLLGLAAAATTLLVRHSVGAQESYPPLAPLPPVGSVNKDLAELGRYLFFDSRLSGDWALSCASCHDPAKGWADGEPLSKGYPASEYFRNAPTIINARYRARFMWDGRLDGADLGTLVRDMVTEAHFMNSDGRLVQERLKQVPEYGVMWEKAFGKGSEPYGPRMFNAVGEYVKTLVSRNAPIDRFLRGDEGALSDQAKQGLRLFLGKARCISCHNGSMVSDGKLHKLGVPESPAPGSSR